MANRRQNTARRWRPDPTKAAINLTGTYTMTVQGVVLKSLEQSLFVREDGVFLTARAMLRGSQATLVFEARRHGDWRSRLARKLLGL